jgi:hypothetical protein
MKVFLCKVLIQSPYNVFVNFLYIIRHIFLNKLVNVIVNVFDNTYINKINI